VYCGSVVVVHLLHNKSCDHSRWPMQADLSINQPVNNANLNRPLPVINRALAFPVMFATLHCNSILHMDGAITLFSFAVAIFAA
jgi:hypothetical protein